jgi:hypothetical protein
LLNNVAACCLSDTEIFPERLPSARFPAVNVSGLWCTVLMNAPLLDPGPDPHPYGEALGVVEMLERRQREMDAARVTLIAAALDQVVEAAGSSGSREIAYRALRAELATALGQSEHLVEQQMSLAHSLTNEYHDVHEALDHGEIAYAHARVIVDAGTVIGSGRAAETVARRAGYLHEVLATASRETPNRLRPIARALAESWAESTVEQRHREARARRHVALVDEDDGMALLMARLPAVEAHAAFDRLTRIAQACARGERVVRDLAAPSTVAAGTKAADTGAASATEADTAEAGATEADTAEADTVAASATATGTAADTAAAPSTASRTRDQLRADVLADLLLSSDEHTLFAGDAAESIRARVQIVISADALRGESGGEARTTADHGTHRGADHGTHREKDCGTHRGTRHGPGHGSALDTPRKTEHTTHGKVHGETPGETGAEAGGGATCELLGYGAIDRGDGRRLAGGAPGWDRVLVEPATGSVLSVDRYRPSEQMRRTLGARDRHCRFPGCRVPVSRCDLDHTVDAALGGATATDNLAHLCRGHHVLKHHSDWTVTQQAGGELRWTSPAGRTYVDRPERFGGSCRPRRPERDGKPPEQARSPLLRAVRAVRFARVDDSVAAF